MATTICSSVKFELPTWQCFHFSDLFNCSDPGFSLSRKQLQRRFSLVTGQTHATEPQRIRKETLLSRNWDIHWGHQMGQ